MSYDESLSMSKNDHDVTVLRVKRPRGCEDIQVARGMSVLDLATETARTKRVKRESIQIYQHMAGDVNLEDHMQLYMLTGHHRGGLCLTVWDCDRHAGHRPRV